MSTFAQDDIRPYLNMDLDDLYGLLVSQDGEEPLFSRGGRVAAGKSIVQTRVTSIRRAVCPQRTTRLDSLDLGVLIADALALDPTLGRLPILPLAALVLKIGIDSFCDDDHAL